MTDHDCDRDVVETLAAELRAANTGGVAGILHADVELVVDNGGDESLGASAHGRLACAEEMTRIAHGGRGEGADRELTVESVNGDCGIVIHAPGAIRGIVAVSVRDGLVDALWAVVSPGKLDGWAGGRPIPR